MGVIQTMSKIVDVSVWQGKIDWVKAKNCIDGAIIRCGYGSKGNDSQFERNASECERLGIPYGVYLYSYAKTESDAKSEAKHILELIKGKKLSYPVYLDCEEKGTEGFAYKACCIVGDEIEKAGYKFGVYANLSWWNNYLAILQDKYTKWVAQYNTKCTYKSKYDMWQYTSSATVSGISGRVDMSECYLNFSEKSNDNANSSRVDDKTDFIKRVQSCIGAKVDGIAGTETISKTPTLSRLFNRRHSVVKVIQERLIQLGYDCGKSGADGIYGTDTANAVKTYQKANGCTADGIITARNLTWKKLLGMIN